MRLTTRCLGMLNQTIMEPNTVSTLLSFLAAPLAAGAAYGAAMGGVKAGQDVLVNAAGSGVGTSAIQVAKLHGARVIASAGSKEKLALARELGADDTVDYTKQDLAAECLKLTGGKGNHRWDQYWKFHALIEI